MGMFDMKGGRTGKFGVIVYKSPIFLLSSRQIR